MAAQLTAHGWNIDPVTHLLRKPETNQAVECPACEGHGYQDETHRCRVCLGTGLK